MRAIESEQRRRLWGGLGRADRTASTRARPRASGRARLPRWTLRLRLTLVYGALFLVAGAVLLAITYGLVAHSGSHTVSVAGRNPALISTQPGFKGLPVPPALPAGGKNATVVYRAQPANGGFGVQLRAYTGKVTSTFQKITAADQAQLRQLAAKAKAELDHQHQAQLDALLTRSGVALGIMAFLSIGLGWLMAGRALRPLRTMSARARGISERNLHERLALTGPDDELKELGDTVDGLLTRLEAAFESQRRFVANASHELRTPITLERALVEVALADPKASVDSLRDTCERVLSASEQQERLIEALLTLARSQRGLESREELDLKEIVGDVVQGVSQPEGVPVETELAEASTTGDPALVERLIANLIDNARQNNEPQGWVKAWTGLRDGRPTVQITNPGPVIPADRMAELLEPFRGVSGQRAGHARGLGLGLSIVSAIATAHGADLRATPRHGGGLEVEVRFPPAA